MGGRIATVQVQLTSTYAVEQIWANAVKVVQKNIISSSADVILSDRMAKNGLGGHIVE